MIKRGLFVCWMWMMLALCAFGQHTTVSSTVTDAGGQIWAFGTYRISFFSNGLPGPFFLAGAPFDPGTTFAGALDSTGSFSGVSVPSSNFITPVGTAWFVTVCPAATTACFTKTLPITGATMNLSTLVVPPAVNVPANQYNHAAAYQDSEIKGPILGFTYYNLTDSTLHVCTGATPCTWVSISGGGGGSPGAPGFSTQYSNSGATGFEAVAGINGLFNGIDLLTNPTLQTIAESERVCGPSPSNDATCYGAFPRANNFTTSGTGSGTTINTAGVVDFQIGDYLDMATGGAATTIVSAPAAPTVTSPWQTGSGTVHAQCVAVDAKLGLYPGAVATFTGAPTQTQQNITATAATRTANVLTITAANSYIAAGAAAPTIVVVAGFVPIDMNGEYTEATANSTTVTIDTGIWTASTETATTLGTVTVYPYIDIQCPSFLTTDPTTQYAIYDDTSGSMHFLQMTLPTLQTEAKDWGQTIEPSADLIPPSFIPTTPPTSPANQVYQGQITNIVGNVFSVTPALSNAVGTNQFIMHDDGPAILAAATVATGTNGGSVTLPPNFNPAHSKGFYQINFPLTLPQKVNLNVGSAVFANATITAPSGNCIQSIFGATNSSLPAFAFLTTAEIIGSGSPMVLFPGSSNCYKNMSTVLVSNAQNGVVVSSSAVTGANQSVFLNDSFSDQGGVAGSVDQPLVFQGGQTGINLENLTFNVGAYIAGPGKLGPPVGSLVLRTEPNCTGCSHGIPNGVEMNGVNNFASRGIMWDNTYTGGQSEQNFRFRAQEMQNLTTPGLMWYGLNGAKDIHVATFEMDSSQANVFGNWGIGTTDLWIDHPTTSGNATVVTGLPVNGIHADLFPITSPGGLLGQNYDGGATYQVNAARMGPYTLSEPDILGINYLTGPLIIPTSGIGQSNVPIAVAYPIPIITVSTIAGTWTAGNYSISRAVVGPNGGEGAHSAAVPITLNGSQGVSVTCTNCPIAGNYGYFDYDFSNALSTTPTFTSTTNYAGLIIAHPTGTADGTGYPLHDATGDYTPQVSAGQLNMGKLNTLPNWAGTGALASGSLVITFSTPYLNAPVCWSKDETTPANTTTDASTTTTLTITGTGTDTVNYFCVGNPN